MVIRAKKVWRLRTQTFHELSKQWQWRWRVCRHVTCGYGELYKIERVHSVYRAQSAYGQILERISR